MSTEPKKKPKAGAKFVTLNPKDEVPPSSVDEMVSSNDADYLIRLGLGDPARLNWYRQVLMRPQAAVSNPALRPYMADVFSRLMNIVASDPQMMARLKVLLQRNFKSDGLHEAVERQPFTIARVKKAIGGFE